MSAEMTIARTWNIRFGKSPRQALDTLSSEELSEEFQFHLNLVKNHRGEICNIKVDFPNQSIEVDSVLGIDPRVLPLFIGLLDGGEYFVRHFYIRERLVWVGEAEWLLLRRQPPPSDFEIPLPKESICKSTHNRYMCPHNYLAPALSATLATSPMSGDLHILPVSDTMHRAENKWALVLPKNPMGRGIDHPCFDASKYSCDPGIRRGMSVFSGKYLKAGATFRDERIDALLPYAVAHGAEIRVDSVPRFLRPSLPTSSFAYWWDPDAFLFCTNAGLRAMQVSPYMLIKAVEPVWIEDAVEDDRENLDKTFGACPEYPYGAGLASSNEAAREYLNSLKGKSANPQGNLGETERAIQYLLEMRSDVPDMFKPPLIKIPESFNGKKLPKLPVVWQKVLRVANGFEVAATIDGCDRILSATEIAKFTQSQRQQYSYVPHHYLFIAIGGERFCVLDLSRQTPSGDCPVEALSFDSEYAEHTWASIGDFIQDLFDC